MSHSTPLKRKANQTSNSQVHQPIEPSHATKKLATSKDSTSKPSKDDQVEKVAINKPSKDSASKPNTPSKNLTRIKDSASKQNKPSKDAASKPNNPSKDAASKQNKPSKDSPNKPSKDAPNKPSKDSPNKPSKDSPNKPSKDAPNKPSKDAPNKPSKDAPNKPSKDAPNKPSKDAPNKPSKGSASKPKNPSKDLTSKPNKASKPSKPSKKGQSASGVGGKRKAAQVKKQVKSKRSKANKACDYESFRKRARACFALVGLSDVEQPVWQSFYGEAAPRKACDLRDHLYSQAVEALLYSDLDPSKVVPTSVLVETNVQSLPRSTELPTHAVFSELRDQLLKCMDGKLDLSACPSCKTDEFMSSCLIQVRSGDEAMGVFPQCLKCKHIVRTHR